MSKIDVNLPDVKNDYVKESKKELKIERKKDKKYLTIYLESEELEKMKKLSQKHKCKISQLAKAIISNYLEDE